MGVTERAGQLPSLGCSVRRNLRGSKRPEKHKDPTNHDIEYIQYTIFSLRYMAYDLWYISIRSLQSMASETTPALGLRTRM